MSDYLPAVPASPENRLNNLSYPQPITDPLDVQIARMSLEEKVAIISYFTIGWWTKTETIDNAQAENTRIFQIFGGEKLTHERLNQLRDALLDPAHPPLITSTDQEDGIVNRLTWVPLFKYIYPGALASVNDIESMRRMGNLTGQMLNLMGINLNLAPYLDLHTDNPGRQISSDPQTIARFGVAFMEGMETAGVGACAKHFPDSNVTGDTDKQIVHSDLSLPEMMVETRYQPLINAGLPAIMMSHVIFDRVDPATPASLSKFWVTDILRNKMGFQGLVISDAIAAPGLQKLGWSNERIIISAFNAGVDLLMGDAQFTAEARDILVKAVKQEKVTEARLNESVRRVLEYNRRFPIAPPPADLQGQQQLLFREAQKMYEELKAKYHWSD
ncbi:MAG: glycoside hydrolase family 3 N-terminal domain-containing protein [Candidatus Margulisbacteria bacterium]|nr:glycoside hydrolase family 3 N-terminal domain-containing protein [Candidatus Margulisiibacteriota bacterium]